MKRYASWLVLVSFILQGCGGQGEVVTAKAPRALATAPATASVEPSLHEIPLAVGYGVDGGWFQLYFTDPSNPAADQMSGGPDEPLVEALDAARLSIDAAMYSLSLRSVRQALVRAHRRGVEVRVVMESDNLDASNPQALKEAGIPILGDRRQGLMHNKFMVIDRADVWTGSMNFTQTGTYSDRNNLIKIHSPRLAADYEAEFNEMFTNDIFGPDIGPASTPYPHVIAGGTALDVYFSPDDHVQKALLTLLSNAQSSIDFLAYSFTSDPLSEAIRSRAKEGVQVRGVMDDGQMHTNSGTEYDRFRTAGLDVRLDAEKGLMHHKVLIIDGETVVMGSYNFTASAEKNNDENVLVIHSPEIAAKYLKEFERVYASAEP